MAFHTFRFRRSAATVIVSLLAAGALAAGASAQDRALELVTTGPTGGNGGFDAHFGRLSDDGTRAFFETNESLVSADTDGALDVYERAGGQTTLVSTGPAGGNLALDAYRVGMSRDGTRVFFATAESLVSADSDVTTDLYERAGGQTTLISTGPVGGNGRFDYVVLQGVSEDGSRVFFETYESLVSADTDAQRDLYERGGGQTTLISTGPAGGNANIPPIFEGASADGTRVFFRTTESLVSADTDGGTWDVYERAGGQTTLVSAGTQARHAVFEGASEDGSRVFFETDESLVSADSDDQIDVYERSGGQTTLVSTGPADAHGASPAVFRGASEDASRVFFDTEESLVSVDADASTDVYERAGGQTTLVSTGPAGGNGELDASLEYGHVSRDGTSVVFLTNESLVSADTDTAQDLYQRADGQTALVSAGPAGGNGNADAWFDDASADGSRVFFETYESLVSADTDDSYDVYERAAGQTTLVSIGPAGGNGARSAVVWDASADGTRVLLATNEPLLSTDTDGADDMYLSRIVPSDNPAPRAPASPGTTPAPVPAPAPAAPGPLPGACGNLRTGTAGRDTLTGGAFGDRLRGLAGNDRLAGLAGDDCLSGGGGHDRLTGGSGHDRLSGGGGRDRLSGGPGADRLTGGAGNDRLTGGAGNDRINARDGRPETVRCGRGNDRVTADRSDTLIACERSKLPDARRRTASRPRAAASTAMGSIASTGDARPDT